MGAPWLGPPEEEKPRHWGACRRPCEVAARVFLEVGRLVDASERREISMKVLSDVEGKQCTTTAEDNARDVNREDARFALAVWRNTAAGRGGRKLGITCGVEVMTVKRMMMLRTRVEARVRKQPSNI